LANLVFYILFVYLSNPGKYQGQISQGNSEKPVAFPRIEVLLMQKTEVYFFPVGGSSTHGLGFNKKNISEVNNVPRELFCLFKHEYI